METLLEIQAQFEKQCDNLEKLKNSIANSKCPEIVCDNLSCIISLLLNSKNHISNEIKQSVSLSQNSDISLRYNIQNLSQNNLKRKEQESVDDKRIKRVKVCIKKISLPTKTIESQTKIKIKPENNFDENTNEVSDNVVENGYTDLDFIGVDFSTIKEEIEIEDNLIEGNQTCIFVTYCCYTDARHE